MVPVRILTGLLFAGALLAQHTYTAADIETGGRLYRANCTVCHGPDGDFVPGVTLGRNKFRRATSDEEIEQIILQGIPGTGMPSHSTLQEAQAENIVAYLHSMATAGRSNLPPGDAGKGKAIYESQGSCSTCHRIRGVGSRMGPDLTDIGSLRRVAELEQSLVDPNAEILPENRFVKLVTKDGTEINGRLLNVDTLTVQILDSQEKLRFFTKSNLREYSVIKNSPMPSYKGKLSTQELADLVSYLVSLKGI
ncbi:MAG TPA: c-type cytochrome [Bryobacteraceae bacterium]|jgi:putative heme-binding domain-containing protein|nr:c-type cytochrome [Bryobacteraceae bacterium]